MISRAPFSPGDVVRLAHTVRVVPAYGGKPAVHRGTDLSVAEVTGRGTDRAPWAVTVTDGSHLWHFDPDDLESTP